MWCFPTNRKAFVSFMVLALVNIFLTVGLAQYTYILLTIKGAQGYWRGSQRQTALLDGPQWIRIHADPYSGRYTTNDVELTYRWDRHHAVLIQTNQIEVTFQQKPHWPQSLGLWIKTPKHHLYIRDVKKP